MKNKLEELKKIDGLPINFQKIRKVKSENKHTVQRCATSKFHQTEYYYLINFYKPISKIVSIKK